MKCLCIFLACIAIARCYSIRDNEIETPRLNTSDKLIVSVMSECFEAESPMNCLKVKVLSFLDTKLGINTESARAFEEKNIDKIIFDRVGKVLNTHEIRFQLPEFLFDNAEVSYRADRGLNVDYPEDKQDNGEARGLLKKKLLLPILVLLKLKMKALMPILVAIIGIKAIKALILSKLAITLVVGFLIYNLVLKKGAMPMMMPTDGPPAAQYGPPAPQYGSPSTAAPAAPQDSYSPAWEPATGGPYARVWDPSQLAYSSYYPNDSQGSNSPTYSSVSSGSSLSTSPTSSAN